MLSHELVFIYNSDRPLFEQTIPEYLDFIEEELRVILDTRDNMMSFMSRYSRSHRLTYPARR